MKHCAYIGLGSNIGSRIEHLQAALASLNNKKTVKIVEKSSIYETDPVGYEDQEMFLNMVIKIKTNLTPEQLLEKCLQTEKMLGRKRMVRWGPRTIDIDILLYDDQTINTKNLTVPHPRMCDRGFVTIPLLEIDKDIKLPTMEQPLRLYVKNKNNHKGVRKWKHTNGDNGFAPIEN